MVINFNSVTFHNESLDKTKKKEYDSQVHYVHFNVHFFYSLFLGQFHRTLVYIIFLCIMYAN